MKHQLDLKSTLIGFLCAVLLTAFISFKNSGDTKPGRYQTAIGESGVVILDTQSGAYMISGGISSKWKMDKRGFHEQDY